MISYIVAKIISINKCSITVENNYIGYTLMVCNKENYEVGKVKKIFLYKHLYITNNKISEELYGFIDYAEKEMFLKLLQYSGIGCKTSLQICSNGVELIKQLINEGNIEALKNLKGITLKIAKTLCEECENLDKTKNNNISELYSALVTLGYPQEDIKKAMNSIDTKKTDISDLISDAIRCIAQCTT
ncbi:MAG: hypothetical protein LBF02_01675 [Mycoplasmataceae bacterium]|jgi:Holliday junction DNA helicase RuvA|nr:hypothetical protein [Mycoplasmataceae bacterium]